MTSPVSALVRTSDLAVPFWIGTTSPPLGPTVARCEQDDASGLSDRERRLGVAAEEQSLHSDEVRPVELDEVADEAMDRDEPLRQRQVRRRFEATVVDRAQPTAGPFDDPVAQRGCPRVDP